MKKLARFLGLFLVLALTVTAFFACVQKDVDDHVELSEELKFTLNSDGSSYSVIGIGTCTDTDVVIPSTYEGLPVTSIGNYAFSGCTSLVSITIPDSVTSIGYDAFTFCTSLVYNEYGNAYYLGNYSNPYLVLVKAKDTSITSCTIHEDTRLIYSSAFSGCTGLTSITIGNSVTSIGENAFRDCTSLVYNKYDNAYYLGNGSNPYLVLVKAKDTSITSCTIHDDSRFIHSSAFYDCTSLKNITIPDSVTSIGKNAFSGCTSLNAVYITDISKWCAINFSYHSANPLYYAKNLYLNRKLVSGDIVLEDVTSIPDYAFYYCTGITSITIPDSVTSIGDGAFSGCSSLESITLPFVGGSAKTSSDTYQYPFGYIFGTSSYDGGVATTQYYYGSSTSYITDNTYYIPSSLKSVTITGGNILYGAFYNCNNLTSITIPDSVTSIGNYAFYSCKSLVSITIPDSVTSIGDFAFDFCTSLVSITIPDSVTSIGNYAFYGCTSLVSIIYTGTISEWQAIYKGSDWNYSTGSYTVHCTDCNFSKANS